MEQVTDWETLCFIGENDLSDACKPYLVSYDYSGNIIAQDFDKFNSVKIENYEFTHFEGASNFIKSILSYPASWMRCIFHMVHPDDIEETFSTHFNVRRFEIQINNIEISTVIQEGFMGEGLIGLARLLFSQTTILRMLQNWEHQSIEQGSSLEKKISEEDAKMQRYQTVLSGHAIFIKKLKIAMAFEPNIQLIPQENVEFGSYHVVGRLVQVPFSNYGEHYARILASDTKKTLVITPYTHDVDDGLVIRGWADFERFKFGNASKVYVAKHFWESADYRHYVRHVSFGITYFPSRVKSSADKFMDPKSFFNSMASVHSAYYSTFTDLRLDGYQDICAEMPCCPFECVKWDRIVISDVKGIGADSIYPLSRVCSAIWLFTTNYPYPSTQEYKMMDSLLRIGHKGTSCVPLSTLLRYCFIQSDGVKTITPIINYELVHMSPIENYLFRRHCPETLLYQQRLVEGAESAVRSNPRSHFQCMTFEGMVYDLRVRSAEDRERLKLEIEQVSKDHEEAVSMLERWAAIPEEKTEEVPTSIPTQPHTIQRIVQSALASQGIQADSMVIVGQGMGLPSLESVDPLNSEHPNSPIEDQSPAPPASLPQGEGEELGESEGSDTDEEYENATVEEDSEELEDVEEENVTHPSEEEVTNRSRIDVMAQHQRAVNRATLRTMIQKYESLRVESLERKQELEKTIETKRLESAEIEGKIRTIQEDFHDDECSLCYGCNNEVLTKCLHSFCAKCVWKIFIRKNMKAPCPFCKKNLEPNDIYFIVKDKVLPQIPIYSKYRMISHYADEYTTREECRTLVIVKDPYSFYSAFHYLNGKNKVMIWDPRFADSAAEMFIGLSVMSDPCIVVTNVSHVDNLPRINNLQYVLCDHYISSNSHKFSYLRQYNPATKRLPHYISFLQNGTKENLLMPDGDDED